MNIVKTVTVAASVAASLAFTGCKTTEYTPFPESTTAVLVGLGYTCDKPELAKDGSALDIATVFETVRYCYNDVMTQTKSKTGPDGITTYDYLYLPKCNYNILQDENATTGNVKARLRAAVQDELAIIYFSCKATQVPAVNDKEEEDGLDECLMLYDGLLKDDEIWEILQTARGRVFIFFDTGHSAGMFKAGKEQTGNIIMDICDDIAEREANAKLNMVCWSSCLEDEVIDERGIGSKMTNVFYLKLQKEDTYQEVFDKIYKSLSNKQNIRKTVIGEDFSDRSVFR